MKIINVVGARPNFMKMAPIIEAMNKYPWKIQHLLVHTGQHYDQKMSKAFFDDLGLKPGGYATLTLHRPSNVDDKQILQGILGALHEISAELPIIFPIHPRTRKMVDQFNLGYYFNQGSEVSGIWLTEPFGYLEFLHLNMQARLVLTDSGGLQEETTVLGVPCLTMRNNTERPITCEVGTNIMVGNQPDEILRQARRILNGTVRQGSIPEKWDGHAAERIVDHILDKNGTK